MRTIDSTINEILELRRDAEEWRRKADGATGSGSYYRGSQYYGHYELSQARECDAKANMLEKILPSLSK